MGDKTVTLLLDTHTYLWWMSDPTLLTTQASSTISDPTNRVLVSLVSLWEIAIKRVIGKLKAPVDLENDVIRIGFELLPISLPHVVTTETLPLLHRDPFDRMLIAQAVMEGATLVTRDQKLKQYTVPVIDA